jgi:multiple sugar transport system permease protein
MSELTITKPRARDWRKFWNNALPYFLVLPVIIYYAVFWLRPVFALIVQSFTSAEGVFTLDNFRMVFADEAFLPALENTAIIVVFSVTIEFFIALGLALLINRKFTGSGIFLFLAMVPMAIPAVAVGAMWITGFTAHGWINSLLYYLGIIDLNQKIYWLAASRTAIMAIIILIDAWQVIPSVMIILLAGLQNIPPETEEAGYVFGGTYFYVLRKITIPILKPTITTAVILRLISAIQIWLIIVMLLGFSRLPVLVERIVFYYDEVENLYNSAQMAAGYTIIVSFIVSTVAMIYLFASGTFSSDKQEARA